jgi:hypothetical protein
MEWDLINNRDIDTSDTHSDNPEDLTGDKEYRDGDIRERIKYLILCPRTDTNEWIEYDRLMIDEFYNRFLKLEEEHRNLARHLEDREDAQRIYAARRKIYLLLLAVFMLIMIFVINHNWEVLSFIPIWVVNFYHDTGWFNGVIVTFVGAFILLTAIGLWQMSVEENCYRFLDKSKIYADTKYPGSLRYQRLVHFKNTIKNRLLARSFWRKRFDIPFYDLIGRYNESKRVQSVIRFMEDTKKKAKDGQPISEEDIDIYTNNLKAIRVVGKWAEKEMSIFEGYKTEQQDKG